MHKEIFSHINLTNFLIQLIKKNPVFCLEVTNLTRREYEKAEKGNSHFWHFKDDKIYLECCAMIYLHIY